MTNILEAISNIVENQIFSLRSAKFGSNRINSVGHALELYIKDAFANTFNVTDELTLDSIFREKFSWLGNQNNPPDAMIRGGDAIEVKKTQKSNSVLALNSSYPKASIRSNSSLIVPAYRNCEIWEERDLIYCVGHTDNNTLKSLWMFYGNIYAANHETYQRISTGIKNGLESLPDIDFAETTELGGIKRVDPLGITNFRIRGMWHIINPRIVFSYLHKGNINKFELVCIIPEKKYASIDEQSKFRLLNISIPGLSIDDVEVKDPNNPANRIACKLIKFIL